MDGQAGWRASTSSRLGSCSSSTSSRFTNQLRRLQRGLRLWCIGLRTGRRRKEEGDLDVPQEERLVRRGSTPGGRGPGSVLLRGVPPSRTFLHSGNARLHPRPERVDEVDHVVGKFPGTVGGDYSLNQFQSTIAVLEAEELITVNHGPFLKSDLAKCEQPEHGRCTC